MSSFKEVKFGNMSSLLTAGYQKEFDSVTFVVHGFMSAGLKLPYPRITIKGKYTLTSLYLKKLHGKF